MKKENFVLPDRTIPVNPDNQDKTLFLLLKTKATSRKIPVPETIILQRRDFHMY